MKRQILLILLSLSAATTAENITGSIWGVGAAFQQNNNRLALQATYGNIKYHKVAWTLWQLVGFVQFGECPYDYEKDEDRIWDWGDWEYKGRYYNGGGGLGLQIGVLLPTIRAGFFIESSGVFYSMTKVYYDLTLQKYWGTDTEHFITGSAGASLLLWVLPNMSIAVGYDLYRGAIISMIWLPRRFLNKVKMQQGGSHAR